MTKAKHSTERKRRLINPRNFIYNISMVTINGTAREGAGLNVEELLKAEGFDKRVVVVGVNDQIAPKDSFPTLILKDGDVVDVFHFMSGG